MKKEVIKFTDLPIGKKHSGKVRDNYDLGDNLLIVATDRISAFDVIMTDPIPGKGEILTQMSVHWFNKTADIIPNHLISTNPEKYPAVCAPYVDLLKGRSMLVKKAKPLSVECIVRGYLTGSGWKDYKQGKPISGITLPPGYIESSQLYPPIFTPSTKAPDGQHDMPISRIQMMGIIGEDLTDQIEAACLRIYNRASYIAKQAGIIIADTKMEFGILDGELILIDELLTPDSSRFWPVNVYEQGRPQPSYDKQYLRDYLISIGWNQQPPPPPLPQEVINMTEAKYAEAWKLLSKVLKG